MSRKTTESSAKYKNVKQLKCPWSANGKNPTTLLELLKLIDKDGITSETYICRDVMSKTEYTARRVRLDTLEEEDKRLRLQEAQRLRHLQHPHILHFYVDWQIGSDQWLLSEAASTTLYQLLLQKGQPPPETLYVQWLYQLSTALSFLHERPQPVLHRNIKPSNVLVVDPYVLKLSDFGVSKKLEGILDFTKTMVGTGFTMSPEIINNLEYNAKTDMWSLGITAVFIATLQKAVEADSFASFFDKVGSGRVRGIGGQYSAETEEEVNNLLQLKPDLRPSASQFLTQLRARCCHCGLNPTLDSYPPRPLVPQRAGLSGQPEIRESFSVGSEENPEETSGGGAGEPVPAPHVFSPVSFNSLSFYLIFLKMDRGDPAQLLQDDASLGRLLYRALKGQSSQPAAVKRFPWPKPSDPSLAGPGGRVQGHPSGGGQVRRRVESKSTCTGDSLYRRQSESDAVSAKPGSFQPSRVQTSSVHKSSGSVSSLPKDGGQGRGQSEGRKGWGSGELSATPQRYRMYPPDSSQSESDSTDSDKEPNPCSQSLNFPRPRRLPPISRSLSETFPQPKAKVQARPKRGPKKKAVPDRRVSESDVQQSPLPEDSEVDQFLLPKDSTQSLLPEDDENLTDDVREFFRISRKLTDTLGADMMFQAACLSSMIPRNELRAWMEQEVPTDTAECLMKDLGSLLVLEEKMERDLQEKR